LAGCGGGTKAGCGVYGGGAKGGTPKDWSLLDLSTP